MISTSDSVFPSRLSSVIVASGFLAYGVFIAVLLWLFQGQYTKEHAIKIPQRPDFTVFEQVDEKKRAFFDYIGVLAVLENQRITEQRNVLKHIVAEYDKNQTLNRRQNKRLKALARDYEVLEADASLPEDIQALLDALLKRVNILPVALVQAQAAIESGWGTSRFAIDGNNLFGQWCFSKGCGIVPENRLAGRTHEVMRFASDRESIRAYMRNLNTFHAYGAFRIARADIEPERLNYAGTELAATLMKYSERGQAYVHEVQGMIRSNDLEH